MFERALDVDPTDVLLWMHYCETVRLFPLASRVSLAPASILTLRLIQTTQELKARNIQHARNLYDRAVTLLPRVDQIWLKFVYLEELLQNIAGARQVFERWMKWEPDDKGRSTQSLVPEISTKSED